MPAVLRGGQSPTASMLGVFGLLAIGVGIALAAATDGRMTEGGTRCLCVASMSLIFASVGGFFDILVQRTSFFDGLGLLHATLLIVFAVLFGFATLGCVAAVRRGAEAFLSPSESLFSFGGSMAPLSFLVLQAMFLIFAAVVGGMIVTQDDGTKDGLLLAIAFALAALPFFVTVQLAICAKRWRDTTARWPSYGALAWAALLGLGTFRDIFEWLESLPGILSGSSPLPPFPHVSLVRVLCYVVSLVACIQFNIASRTHARRGFFLRVLGNTALGLGSLLFVSLGFALSDAQWVTPIRLVFLIKLAFLFIAAAGLIAGAHFLVFRRNKNVAV